MMQLPWLVLDYACATESLVPEVFAWGAKRASAIAHERGEEFWLGIYISPHNATHIGTCSRFVRYRLTLGS